MQPAQQITKLQRPLDKTKTIKIQTVLILMPFVMKWIFKPLCTFIGKCNPFWFILSPMAIALKLSFYYALNLKVMSFFSEPGKQRILKYKYSLPPFIIGNEKNLQYLCLLFWFFFLISTYQVSSAWLECRVLKGRKQGR